MYNDGFGGSGIAPDTNAPGSQVGDVGAVIDMTSNGVYFSLYRCTTAVCSEKTFVKSNTLLGNVTIGSTHTLLLKWDETGHTVTFQLDANAPVSFDPVAAGYPMAGKPNFPLKRLSVVAGPSGPTPSEKFGPGSSGSITATFDNVKTAP